MNAISEAVIDSPVGPLRLRAHDEALIEVRFENDEAKPSGRVPASAPANEARARVLELAARQLAEYFAGERRSFDLPLDPRGTEFQLLAWSELAKIPYGETTTYGALATAVGRAKACRAIGAANGRNPLAIVVPCHRAIGANGALTGFGGGLRAKQILLDIERRASADPASAADAQAQRDLDSSAASGAPTEYARAVIAAVEDLRASGNSDFTPPQWRR